MYLKNKKFTTDPHPLHITGEEAEAVVLYADMRDFSMWFLSANPQLVADVMDAQYHNAIDIISDNQASFLKFLGDGFLLIWEISDDVERLDAAVFSINSAFMP